MRRSFIWLLLVGMLATACTGGDATTPSAVITPGGATTAVAPGHESTDADTAFFDAVQSPATIEWREPAAGLGSTKPAFIHGIDAATGDERWRLEVPWPNSPWLQMVGDRLVYSYENLGDEDVIVAVGLDGNPLWQATTNWRFHGPFYATDELLIGLAQARDRNVGARYAIVALDIDDGLLVWEAKLRWRPENGIQGWVAGGSGAVYVVRSNGRTIAFDSATGERRWSVKLENRVVGAPLHDDGAVFVGTRSGLVALDAVDGTDLWFASTGRRQIASPEGVASGNTIAWLSDPRNPGFEVAAADLTNGTAMWTAHSYRQYHVGDSAVVGFQHDESRDYPSQVLVWAGSDGRVLADVDTDANVNPFSVAITEGNVYVGTVEVDSEPGRLISIDLAEGTAAWKTTLGGSLGPLTTDSTAVYASSQVSTQPRRGALHSVARASGEVLWTFAADAEINTQPLLANGLVFVVSAEVIPAGSSPGRK